MRKRKQRRRNNFCTKWCLILQSIGLENGSRVHYVVEKPEIRPICGKNPVHAEIRVHKICVFLGRTVHTHGRIKGWGKLLKKKPPPFRMTKRVSELYRKTENAVVPFRKSKNRYIGKGVYQEIIHCSDVKLKEK